MLQTLLDQINTMAEGFVSSLPAMAIALIILGITWAIAKGATRISARIIGQTELRPSLRNLVETLVRLGVWLGGAMIAAIVIFPNFSPSGLIAGLGIGAVVIGVSYDTDLDEASDVIEKAVRSVDLISPEKDVQVLADTFNSSSVDFRVRWWAASSGTDAVMNRDQVVRAIKRGLDKAGIEIPFPYVTHTFKDRVPVVEELREAA